MKSVVTLILFFSTISLQAAVCDLKAPIKSYHPKYAQHFSIDYFQQFKVVHVDKESYLLTDKKLNCEFTEGIVHTPVRRVALMSTTYLPALELINEEKSLVAFQGKRYIVSKKFNLNNVKEISYKFNHEDLLVLKADLIMGYDSNLNGTHQKEIFHSLQLPVVINKDFEEKSPLARAEWLVYTTSFYNREADAIKIFNQIDSDYQKLKTENAKRKKTDVLVGDIQAGSWVTCGGESDLAQLIRDAGGNLLFSRPSANTQKISLEEIMQKKPTPDVWLTHNMWESAKERQEVSSRDQRYLMIKAKSVYNNNLINNQSKASDYWETAMQRPDLLLRDLSSLFHPEDFKNYKLNWYRPL